MWCVCVLGVHQILVKRRPKLDYTFLSFLSPLLFHLPSLTFFPFISPSPSPVPSSSLPLPRYRDGISESAQLVQWLWQTLDLFTNEEKTLFLRFVSGRSRLPTRVSEIPQRFQIMKGQVRQAGIPCKIYTCILIGEGRFS